MAVIMPDEGAQKIADILYSQLAGSPSNVKIMLWKNDYTPDVTTEHSDLTDANFSGYAEQYLSLSSPTTTGGVATMEAGSVTFTHNGGGTANTIYGYAVYIYSSPLPIWYIERFATPKVMALNGDYITIDGKFLLELP